MKLLLTTSLLFSAFLIANSTIELDNSSKLQDYYQSIADKENQLNEELNNGVYEIDAYEACCFTTRNDNYCNRLFDVGVND